MSEKLWDIEHGESDYDAMQRQLGSLGLVDALAEEPPIQEEHPEDEKWIIRSAD